MNFVQKWMTQIQAQLQNLTLSQKLLVGTLAVMIPMMMWIVWQYAAEPEMVPLLRGQTIAKEKRGQIIDYLEGREVPYRESGDQILVPRERSMHLLASLSMKGALPADTSAGFDAIVRETSWWESSAQGERRYNIALQTVLGAVLRNMPWVQDATVIISRPQRIAGFGPTHQHPTASVNLVTVGEPLNQRRVDAVAALVSGAVAEMRLQDVTVIDAQVGRQWTVRDDSTMLASDYMEAVSKQEIYYRTKIGEVFNYIPRVIVAVNVEVDMRKSRLDKISYDKKASAELLIRQRSQSTENKGSADGGEPAVRSNVGVDIVGAGGGGTNSTSDESESEFSAHPGREHVISEDPGGMPTKISATVNIPRSFFVAQYRAGAGADAEEPTDEVLKPIADPYLARFKKQVENLVATKTPGEVVVDVYPDQLASAADTEKAALASAGGALMGAAYLKPLGLGAMAAVALVLMAMMVRKAGQRPALPSAAELAGITPGEDDEDELMSEIGEDDLALAGVELDEQSLRSRKLVEQVVRMVDDNPEDVAGLLKRWVRAET